MALIRANTSNIVLITIINERIWDILSDCTVLVDIRPCYFISGSPLVLCPENRFLCLPEFLPEKQADGAGHGRIRPGAEA